MNDYDVIVISGECSYWACIPSKTVMLPGEAVPGARKSAAKAEFDVDAALAWQRLQKRKVRSNAVLKRDFGRVPDDLPAAQASRIYSKEGEEWKTTP
jgi:pyruvate/2-oxoglutarate dehydrogenase complex dihydrolipoamide dehydrogenase (E3) component